MVLSAIFFVSTAISRGWVGPAAQLSLATALAVGLIVQSFRFDDDHRPWALTMATGGATALFASGVIGYAGLDLLSYAAAVGWLAGSILVFLVLARQHRFELPAVLSAPATLVGATLVSLVDGGEAELVALIGASYVWIVIGVTSRQDWFVARSVGVGSGALLAAVGLYASATGTASTALVVALTVFAVAGVAAAAVVQALDFARVEPTLLASAEARIAALALPWTALTIAAVIDELGDGPWDPGWTIFVVGLLGGALITTLGRRPEATMTVLHQISAIGLMAVGSAIVFDGPALLVALLGHTAGVVFLAERTRSPEVTIVAVILAGATGLGAAGLIVKGSLIEALTPSEIAAVGAVAVSIAAASWRYGRMDGLGHVRVVGLIALLGWFAVARLAFPQGDMITSLLWAGLGTALIALGSRCNDRPLVWGGLTTLGLTTTKLLTVDLAAVDVLWRAALFFVVGSVFLRLAYLVPSMLDKQ